MGSLLSLAIWTPIVFASVCSLWDADEHAPWCVGLR